MPSSALNRSIRRTRQRIDALEGPIRAEMAALYARTVNSLTTDLQLITQRIEQARAAGEHVNPDWLRQQDRYIQLIGQAERQFLRFADDGMRLLDTARARAVRGGAAEAWELMDASGIDIGFGANINIIAVENAVGATHTRPLRRSLDAYGPEGAKTITDALLDGIARGRGPRQMIRDIERQLNGPYNRSRLEALVRTETMRAFRAGLNAQYAEMGHLIQGYRWSAAKSRRTCLACLARDGKVRKQPWSQFHVNCRCINTPVPIGSTLTYESGPAWFARQSEDVQRRMLPSRTAFDAYQDGRLGLDAFVGTHRDRIWGSSVYQKSGRQAMEAGR